MAEPAHEPQYWTKVIEPHRGFFSVGWGELWAYRDLIWQLVVRDFTTAYKQTLLGPFWFVIQPLLMTVAFSFLFGRMAKFTTDGLPHFLFYIGGLAPWNYFADCVSKTAFTFSKNAPVFGKVYFPRLAVPIAGVISALVALGVRLAILLAGIAFYLWKDVAIHPNWRIATIPLLVVNMAMLGLGVGCLVSALTTRFRDLAAGVGFTLQLWMYASLIIFPLSRISPESRWIFLLNPMVPMIEGFRFAFLGAGTVERWHLGLSFAVSSVVLAAGVLLFNRAARDVMDTV